MSKCNNNSIQIHIYICNCFWICSYYSVLLFRRNWSLNPKNQRRNQANHLSSTSLTCLELSKRAFRLMSKLHLICRRSISWSYRSVTTEFLLSFLTLRDYCRLWNDVSKLRFQFNNTYLTVFTFKNILPLLKSGFLATNIMRFLRSNKWLL